MANYQVLGHELTLILDGSLVAYTTDFDIEVNKQSVDTTSFLSGAWKESKVYGKDWKVGFSGMVGNYDGSCYADFDVYLNKLLVSDASVYVAIKRDSTGANWLTGCAHMLSLKASGSRGVVVAYQGSLEGTSPLTLTALAA